VVALGGGVQPVDRLHGDVDGGVEAEGVVGGTEVVVDGLRDTDHVDAELVQLGGHAEGVLTADRDQGVDALRGEVVLDPLDPVLDLEGVGAGRAEDGAAAGQDAADLRDTQGAGQALEGTLPAVPETHEFVTVVGDALADHRPDHRVETWAVAAAGEHADTHDLLILLGASMKPGLPQDMRHIRPSAPLPARGGPSVRTVVAESARRPAAPGASRLPVSS
jgi:hypothetical protein